MGARRPRSPRDPNWISFEDALEFAYRQCGDARTAWNELHNIPHLHRKWIGTGDPQRPSHRLLRADENPETDFRFTWTGSKAVLGDSCRDEIEFTLNGEPGLLFVWKPDVEEYFGVTAEPAQEVAPEPKVIVKSSGPFKDDWIRQTVEALKLRRDYPNELPHAIAVKLDQLLEDNNQENIPVSSKLGELVKKIFEFDDNPLKRPSFKKGKKG